MTKHLAAALAALVVSWPLGAGAQVPTVTPDGKLADPAAPPPAAAPPPPPPTTIIVPAPGGAAQPGAAGTPGAPAADTGTGTGYYHTDDYGDLTDEQGGMIDTGDGRVQVHGGSVPGVHTVRRGDTLWDISWFYFNNPWEWPRVWSYNPEITNPHWIYPGDQVRLYEGGQAPATAGTGNQGGGAAGPDQPVAARPQTGEGFFELRQLAFVSDEELKLAITVDGSPEEKMLLAAGDEVYLAYPKQRPPRVGQRYAVYQERKKVVHPESGKSVGAYVKIVGEVEVISVKQDKRARAVILDSVDVIERGQRVGPLQRQFKNVDPTLAEVDLEGTIVADISAEQLIGARQVVVLDRGKESGVKVGNKLHVVRRGDAYQKVMGPRTNIGKNDTRYPARSIGEVMVVQTGKKNSIAVVTRSDKEFGVGDRVLMVRGK